MRSCPVLNILSPPLKNSQKMVIVQLEREQVPIRRAGMLEAALLWPAGLAHTSTLLFLCMETCATL